MADKDKMSLEEILNACRKMDGGGSGGGAQEGAAESAEPAEQAPSGSAPTKKPSEMSVEEMLAAARAEKSGGAGSAAKAPTAETQPAAAKAPAGPAKKPGEMSVEEMLAAARAEKSKPSGAKAQPASGAAKPVAKKPAAEKPAAAKQPAAAKPGGGPVDTASILAAARKEVRRGPMSKEEASQASRPAAQAAPKPKVPPMPKKPEFLTATAPSKQEESRRGFFGSLTGLIFGSAMACGFVSLAVTHLLWALGLARFMFPNILIEPPTKFKVGFPDEIGPGQVVTKFKAQFGVWIVRNMFEGIDQIYALRSVCTHLGCTPNWLEAEQKFKCPCHGSGFYKSGINFEGPAPRPLERYAIALADDGQLQVDKSKKFQQELGQWKDPQSYLPV